MPVSVNWSPSFRFPHKIILACICLLPMHATFPTHLIPHLFTFSEVLGCKWVKHIIYIHYASVWAVPGFSCLIYHVGRIMFQTIPILLVNLSLSKNN
jgi:hypothetical protein